MYTAYEPVLLMEDVIYARCGRDDVVAVREDGTYWVCGLYAGNVERPLPVYHEVTDERVICTHEFVQYSAEDIYSKWGVAVE